MIFRLTKICAEQIHADFQEETKSQNRYCDWFCDIFTGSGNKKYFLLTNAFSLFSVIFQAKEIDSQKSFFESALNELKTYFESKNLGEIYKTYIEQNLNEIRFEKTNSKSVSAGMTAIKYEVFYRIKFNGDISAAENRIKTNDDINSAPRKCANSGEKDYIFPKDFISSPKMQEAVSDSVPPQKKSRPCYQIYAELNDFKPKIWRRFLINKKCTMETFACALMCMFNMNGSHIYEFDILVKEALKTGFKNKGFTDEQIKRSLPFVPDVVVQSYVDEEINAADDDFMQNELHQLPPKRVEAYNTTLSRFLNRDLPICTFKYDFGDGWEIKITLENDNADADEKKLPVVLDGVGLGIIEDCGGVGGLEEIRTLSKTKKGEQYENYKEWLGGELPNIDMFNKDEINKSLPKDVKNLRNAFYE